ncbi:hypothetical protein IIA15_08025 [candidate division TA06 bacterium]|nr:hypothetical protein [candidate division TA06 bacterium]
MMRKITPGDVIARLVLICLRQRRNSTKQSRISCFIMGLLLFLPFLASGQTLMFSDVLSEAGVEASSASFILKGSVAQPVIGLFGDVATNEGAIRELPADGVDG